MTQNVVEPVRCRVKIIENDTAVIPARCGQDAQFIGSGYGQSAYQCPSGHVVYRGHDESTSYCTSLPEHGHVDDSPADYCGCCGGEADRPPKGEHGECCGNLHDTDS